MAEQALVFDPPLALKDWYGLPVEIVRFEAGGLYDANGVEYCVERCAWDDLVGQPPLTPRAPGHESGEEA